MDGRSAFDRKGRVEVTGTEQNRNNAERCVMPLRGRCLKSGALKCRTTGEDASNGGIREIRGVGSRENGNLRKAVKSVLRWIMRIGCRKEAWMPACNGQVGCSGIEAVVR